MTVTALLDANVLYPAPLRDLLLQLAVAKLFRARWTDTIHDEWIGAAGRVRPQTSPGRNGTPSVRSWTEAWRIASSPASNR